MDWKYLLSRKRLGVKSEPESNSSKARTVFQKDFDRIIFSSAFRKLQNKTQVFPIPKSDFVRNRLTHSLETSSVGRSLGNMIGEFVLDKYPRLKSDYNMSDFGAIVSAACLVHDIGNPPFGHSGEEAISSFFRRESSKKYISNLTYAQKYDLQYFEGNAAGFRLITKTPKAHSDITNGLGLTYPTYASFVKYPKGSYPKIKDKKVGILKKFNFFDSDKSSYFDIADTLKISKFEYEGKEYHNRFPLAFLVEAADDICYTMIDYEDGFQEGLISFEEAENAYMSIIGGNSPNFESKYKQISSKSGKISYLRSKSINTLIMQTVDIFKALEGDILEGKLLTSLLDSISASDIIKNIKTDSFERIYNSENVVKKEIAGFQVLPRLLEIFVDAMFNPNDSLNKKIIKLIPDEYLDKERKIFDDDYEKLLNISMFVASMTDKFAVELYKQLNGYTLISGS